MRGPRVFYFQEKAAGNRRELTPKIARTWLAAVEGRAGFPARGAFHILRHTFCSRLAMRNAPVMVIKELAGHQSIKTTMKYMHLARGAKHDAIALLDKPQESPEDKSSRASGL